MTRNITLSAGAAIGALLVASVPAVAHAADESSERVFEPTAINRDAPVVEVEESWAEAHLDDEQLQELEESEDALRAVLDSGADIQSVPSDVLPEDDYSIGSVPWTATESFELWEGATAEVNLDSGNLLVSVTDWESNAPGIAPRMTRYYNSLSDRESVYLGNWILGVGGDVGVAGAYSGGDEAFINTFYAPTGYTANMAYDSEPSSGSGETTPDGLNISIEAMEGLPYVEAIEWNRSGNRMRFSADQGQSGWLLKEEDRNGVGTAYGYASGDVTTTMTDAAGRTSTFSGAGVNNRYFEAFDGREWFYQQTDGNLTYVEGPDVFAEHYTYDDGRLTLLRTDTEEDDVAGPEPVMSIEYDEQGRVASLAQGKWDEDDDSFEELSRSSFTYEATQTLVTDARENTSTYVLDDQGRQMEAIDANGNSRTQEWTANSDIASTTDALDAGDGTGNTATYSYDDLHNLTGSTLPTGAAASAAYAQGVDCPNAGTGNPYLADCVTDASGNTTEYEYDQDGNLTKESRDAGAVTHEYTYDNDDREICGGFAGQICSATDGNSNTTAYTYNGNGDLASVTPPSPQGETVYEYDASSRLVSVTDANGDTTIYTYDIRDRLLTTTYEDGSSSRTDYGPQGSLLYENFTSDGITQTVAYSYDALMREIGKTVTGANSAQYTQRYDAAGNLTSYSGPGGSTAAAYDDANQLITLSEPGGICVGDFPTAGTKCVFFEYDGNGAETLRTFPGGAAQETVRDESGRPTRIVATDADRTTRVDIGYSYTLDGDDTGTIQSRTSTLEEGITPGAVTTYTYDALSRVTSATEEADGTETASWAYEYDAAGNRTEQTTSGDTGTDAGTVSYDYDAANRLVSTSLDESDWTYDAAGNLTQNGITGETTSYGARGEVTSIGSTDYTSIHQGNTDTLADSTGDSFYRSTLGVMTRASTSGDTNYLLDNTGIPVGFAENSSHYYVTDHLDSVVGIFAADGTWEGGYSYSPYGEERATANTSAVEANQLRYISGEVEADGTYRFGARYYDPSIGRFTQMDPSGQESNPYSYASCNPVNATDPTGLASSCVITGFVLTSIGFIAAVVAGIAGVVAAPVTGGVSLAGTVAGISTAVGIIVGGPGLLISAAGLMGNC